jgi:hypothetical protein
MAEIHKLSVEKTLNKLRANDAKQSRFPATSYVREVGIALILVFALICLRLTG